MAKIDVLRQAVAGWRRQGQRIALVPTMGNLHAGHLSLLALARKHAQRIVVSIFVNPAQFGPREDLASYPRTLQQDEVYLREVGADLLFIPHTETIYPHGGKMATAVEVPQLSNILCGVFRPEHFRGVATVVNILCNLVQADCAVFGEKDYQQLTIIKRMVSDLSIPVQIIAAPTVREADGLAMSSRNQYLDHQQRSLAKQLYEVINQVKAKLIRGSADYTQLESWAEQTLTQHGFRSEYVAIRNAADLACPQPDRPKRILAAAWLGSCRLIDNVDASSAVSSTAHT